MIYKLHFNKTNFKKISMGTFINLHAQAEVHVSEITALWWNLSISIFKAPQVTALWTQGQESLLQKQI